MNRPGMSTQGSAWACSRIRVAAIVAEMSLADKCQLLRTRDVACANQTDARGWSLGCRSSIVQSHLRRALDQARPKRKSHFAERLQVGLCVNEGRVDIAVSQAIGNGFDGGVVSQHTDERPTMGNELRDQDPPDYVFITHFDDLYFIKDKNKANITDHDVCSFLVALTRARKRVYLISSNPRATPTFLTWIAPDRIEDLTAPGDRPEPEAPQ